MGGDQFPVLDESILARARIKTTETHGLIWLIDTILVVFVGSATSILLLRLSLDGGYWEPILSGAAVLMFIFVGIGIVFLFHLLRAPFHQRNEARDLLRLFSEKPFVIPDGPPLHIPPVGQGLVFRPLRLSYLGSENASIERISGEVFLGFVRDNGWGTEPGAAIATPEPFQLRPAELSWDLHQEDRVWELEGLPVVLRPAQHLQLPGIGVEIIDEAMVREVYKYPEGANIYFDITIRSSAGFDSLRHTIPVVFADETGADLVPRKNED